MRGRRTADLIEALHNASHDLDTLKARIDNAKQDVLRTRLRQR